MGIIWSYLWRWLGLVSAEDDFRGVEAAGRMENTPRQRQRQRAPLPPFEIPLLIRKTAAIGDRSPQANYRRHSLIGREQCHALLPQTPAIQGQCVAWCTSVWYLVSGGVYSLHPDRQLKSKLTTKDEKPFPASQTHHLILTLITSAAIRFHL